MLIGDDHGNDDGDIKDIDGADDGYNGTEGDVDDESEAGPGEEGALKHKH